MNPSPTRTPRRVSTLRVPKSLICILSFAAATPSFAAKAEGVPESAPSLVHIGPLPISNSMIMSWLVALAIIAIVRIAAL